jgi:hypothetical protein
MHRPAGRQGPRRRSPGGQGGRCGGRGWGGGRCEKYEDEESRRPGQVGEEAGRVTRADDGRPSGWRGARVSAGRWTADSGRPAAVENPGGQRTGGAAEGGGRGG